MNTSKMLEKLSGIMSISGSERRGENEVRELLTPYFDKFEVTNTGSYVLTKYSKDQNAPTVLIDAHFDEIGMFVKEITEEGFLRITNVGGIDSRIMPASRVLIYGKKVICGVVVSTPPHLQKPDESKKLPEFRSLLIDTGYSAEKLNEIVRIGTPIGFATEYTELQDGHAAGHGFDNKACAVAAVKAAEMLSMTRSDFNIAVLLSSFEEIGGVGAATALAKIDPDVAFVLDVNLAQEEDVPKHRTVEIGKGPAISYSTVTHRSLVDSIVSFAKNNNLNYQTIAEARGTGTNADIISTSLCGIPTAVISVPLRNMHTPNEVVSLKDIDDTACLLAKYIGEEMPKWMKD